MDEKTPHMHFFHVPVTQDGRLKPTKFIRVRVCENCNPNFPPICKAEVLPIERGVEQTPGSAKKHLDTREFKQQKEELARLAQEAAVLMRDSLRSLGFWGNAKRN